jgi:predicted MFS family arabinose efflux permease
VVRFVFCGLQALNNGISHAVYEGRAHAGWRASFAAASWCPLLLLLLMVFVLPGT